MAATKANIPITATLTAAAGDTTATGVDLRTTYAALYAIKLTNGATGPTIPAQVQVQVSADDSGYYNFGGPLVGGTANNAVSSWTVELPSAAKYARTVSGSNTGQNVALATEVMDITAI